MKLHVKRVELKYRISAQEAILLKSRLDRLMKRDLHAAGGAYFIRSLYFDNKSSRCFSEKEEGFAERQKYRLRIYDFSQKLVKFEAKRKFNDMILKDSSTLSVEDCAAVMDGNYDCLLHYRDRTLNGIYYEFKRDYYSPVVVVDYYRDAYMLDYNNIRVTFDHGVKRSGHVESFFDPQLLLVPILERDQVILEIKYDHFFPEWLGRALEGFRYLRCANSKYHQARLV